MAFPNEFLHNPEWHAKPIAERERELSGRDPEFAKFPEDRRRQILDRAAAKFGGSGGSGSSNVGRESSAGPPPPAPISGMIGNAIQDVKLGFRGGAADLAHTVSTVARPLGATNVADKADEFASRTQPTEAEMRGRDSITSQVFQGAGAAVPTMVKYLPAERAGKYAPLAAGVIGAVSHSREGLVPALKAGAKDAAQFALMGKASRLPSRVGRAVASGVAAAGVTAVTGGSAKEVAAAGVMGTGFGAIGEGEKSSKPTLTPEQGAALLEGGVEGVSKVKDFVRRAVAPQNRGPEARREAGIIRANSSDIYRQADIAEYALQNASKAFRSMPDEQRMSVIHAIEQPEAHPLDPKMRGFVDTMRQIHNQVRDELIEEGSFRDPNTGEKKYTVLGGVKRALSGDADAVMQSYYENYYPHLFTDPEKAGDVMRAMMAGKRPLEGPATFTRQRKYPTIEEALSVQGEDGKPVLKMVTTDPVEAYMLKWREMKRYTAALRIQKEMAGSDLLRWVEVGKRGPQGWNEIKNSKAFQQMQEERDGLKVARTAWAPEQAARVLNNYLSPGLRGHNTLGPAFRSIMGFNNILNQAQLGFSAFHLGFTSVDAVTSKFALGVEKLVEGGIKRQDGKMVASGLKDISKAVAVFPALVENVKVGRRMRQEWLKPGSTDPHTAQMVQMMQEAGGGLSLDPVYRTDMRHRMFESMRQHGGFVQALLGDAGLIPKSLLAGNEAFANLIMNEFVPWQKLGVFADLAKFEMERLPEGATRAQVREVYGRAWDSVDNRMGMLRYDNLFWGKWIKDIAMVSMRSVGWNLGTLRELGGGLMDWRKAGADLIKKRDPRAVEFTHRMAYTIAMPAMTGLMGSMIHLMYNGKGPESVMDRFFPRTGRKDEFGRDERISVPSYIKDAYHMAEAAGDVATGVGGAKAVGLVGSKVHSSWGVIADMLQNKDFYGTQIANPDDPFVKRMQDYGQFLVGQYHPFSYDTISKLQKSGAGPGEMIGAAFGFVPAPADIKKTRAERVATEIMAENLPRRSNTREDRERQSARREVERMIRMGADWQTYARQQVEAGVLSDSDIMHAADRSSGLPLDRSVERMRIHDIPRVWKVATLEEKRRLRPLLEKKVESSAESIGSMPAKQRERLMKDLWAIMNEELPELPPGR